MADVVEMLALSPTMDEGTLVEWTIDEGDTVDEGQVLADVETDKATMEMESFFGGTLLKQLVDEGQAVPVGQPIAVVGQADEDISELLDELQADKSDESAEPGDETNAQPDQAQPDQAQPDQAQPEQADRAQPDQAQSDDGRLKASPLARRMADEAGLELATIDGSGPAGRIIKRDIEARLDAGSQPAKPADRASPQSERPAAADAAGQQQPLSQMRKTIARRLQDAWRTTPHFTLTKSIDMAKAMDKRHEINDGLAGADIDAKVSVNDMIVKACAVALAEFPAMNVAYQGDHLLVFDDVHIGVAVAIEDGLITPTVRDADQKGLRQLSDEVRQLARRAQDKKLQPDEYTGATFSVSNLGMFDIDHFMAIINPPQAGILACGAVKKVPVVVDDDTLAVGTRMKVTLSCDHRAVDGAVGARFLNHVQRLLEHPVLLMV